MKNLVSKVCIPFENFIGEKVGIAALCAGFRERKGKNIEKSGLVQFEREIRR